ncbi:MAG: hypothetical protein C4K48_05085 [Candidatus Thorarchaeota archaeon]|nr:MAG: hypothetical protein C4K48_05085 [Candidatus Thorarchaeota archaeon]
MVALLLAISLLSLTVVSIEIPTCDANIGNVAMMQEGSTFHNGTDINMPYADVSINITRLIDCATVNMTAVFAVYSNITQNATLAFMYPSFNRIGIVYNSTDVSGNPISFQTNGTMQIIANATIMNYTIVFWDDFIESGFIDDFLYHAPFVHPFADFAVFDLELTANTTLIFTVVSDSVYILTDIDLFQYYYIVGSARTFIGDTHEKIHLRLIEHAAFLETEFSPNETLTVSQDGIITEAIWEFNISQFTQDVIVFNGQIRNSQGPLIDHGWLLIIGGVVAMIVILIPRLRTRADSEIQPIV